MQGPMPRSEAPGWAPNVPLAHFTDQKTELWEASREPQVTMTQFWLVSSGSQQCLGPHLRGVTEAKSQRRAGTANTQLSQLSPQNSVQHVPPLHPASGHQGAQPPNQGPPAHLTLWDSGCGLPKKQTQ